MTFRKLIESIGCPYRYMDEFVRVFPDAPAATNIARVSEDCISRCKIWEVWSCEECWNITWNLEFGEEK